MAKVQAGLPLSVLDRDIILEVLRKAWLTPKEHRAFLRLAKLKQIEVAEELAQHTVNLKTVPDRAQWVRSVYGALEGKTKSLPSKGALKEFKARMRNKRKQGAR